MQWLQIDDARAFGRRATLVIADEDRRERIESAISAMHEAFRRCEHLVHIGEHVGHQRARSFSAHAQAVRMMLSIEECCGFQPRTRSAFAALATRLGGSPARGGAILRVILPPEMRSTASASSLTDVPVP